MSRNETSSAAASRTASAANDDEEPFYELRDLEGRTLMLEVRLRTGDSIAFPYAYLIEVRRARSSGIHLRFTAGSVKIAGRNLQQLYEAFCTQRVLWVREGSADRDFGPEELPFITAISIESR